MRRRESCNLKFLLVACDVERGSFGCTLETDFCWGRFRRLVSVQGLWDVDVDVDADFARALVFRFYV